MARKFDLVVIGAGPGGGAGAAAAAKAGLSVALIEERGFGGTCPLRGCNPKKVLTGPADIIAATRNMQDKGVSGEVGIDWPELMRFKESFVDGVDEEVENAYAELGIETIRGRGRFTSPQTVSVDGEELSFDKALIGVGLVPRPLSEPGAKHIATSEEFLELDELPSRIVFVGGGFISFEFAHIAARAGASCVILHRSKRPLKGFDADMVDTLVEATREAGIDVRLETPLHSVEKSGGTCQVRAGEDGSEGIVCDLVVHGAGRVPALDGLGLDAAGVEHSDKGVAVSEYMRSPSNTRVYAAGDAAATPYALTPTGDWEGKVAAHNIVHGDERTVSYDAVASVVFTIPPLCAVGLDEDTAGARGIEVDVRTGSLAGSFSWKRLGERRGAYKVLLEKKTGRIVGGHAVGRGADELANLFALAVNARLTADDVTSTVWAYPTMGYYFKYMV